MIVRFVELIKGMPSPRQKGINTHTDVPTGRQLTCANVLRCRDTSWRRRVACPDKRGGIAQLAEQSALNR